MVIIHQQQPITYASSTFVWSTRLEKIGAGGAHTKYLSKFMNTELHVKTDSKINLKKYIRLYKISYSEAIERRFFG